MDPAWAHEEVVLRPYDARWAERAEAVRTRLVVVLAPWLVAGVEHIGSTSVPGLAAKPVLDLMASVSDRSAVVGALVDDGWAHVPPELDGQDWRRFFVRPDASGRHRVAHLHVLRAGHHRWHDQLAFRDALRREPELRDRYAALKQDLADRFAHDREAYTAAKGGFIAEVLRRPASAP
ncbi:GrpB family protein [Saccharothrix obliqua]|uniref:GrpB family protein n=1 Tax=Saccharothrix obliqua TaxID=2861747 RepID=UPI001C5DD5E7|nr:GrpB family protein [Saccharothrix obliqua]MBW4719730.1 GrpB family protein [Saccharothrix obliqua]